MLVSNAEAKSLEMYNEANILSKSLKILRLLDLYLHSLSTTKLNGFTHDSALMVSLGHGSYVNWELANNLIDMYFRSESVDTIANHILALYAGKVAAYSRADKRLEIRLDREATGRAHFDFLLKDRS